MSQRNQISIDFASVEQTLDGFRNLKLEDAFVRCNGYYDALLSQSFRMPEINHKDVLKIVLESYSELYAKLKSEETK